MSQSNWFYAVTAASIGLSQALGAAPALGEPFRLSFPAQCKLGVECHIQNYVDIDPGAGTKDFRCGNATYNGHKGTDVRLLSTRHAQANVAVLAAAPGVITATRDGMVDRLIGRGVAAPTGRECGNGVVIDHGDGWVTQYCHLLKGSIGVRRGQRIARGARLGSIGFSGKAQFAHLHLSVRQNGKPIDPFLGVAIGASCQRKPGAGLWMPGAVDAAGDSVLIDAGFADRAIGTQLAETGQVQRLKVSAASPALVFYARYINLHVGDRVRMSLRGPAGFRADADTAPLVRAKAQFIAYTGKKLKARRWPSGRYQAQVSLVRNGKLVDVKRYSMDLP